MSTLDSGAVLWYPKITFLPPKGQTERSEDVMRFPDVLIEFKRLEERMRLLDGDLRVIRSMLIRIEGTKAYLGADVSRGTLGGSVEDTHAQPSLFDAE